MMTGLGTNTYLAGTGEVAVIDPGPDDAGHTAAILAAAGGRIAGILITHRHPDHALGAARLARETGAPVYAFDDEAAGSPGGGLPPTVALRDGDAVAAGGATLLALHTPGHAADHLCLLLCEENALFSGDLIISGSTVVIAPPAGDMAAYLRSLERVRALAPARIYPGHGDVIDDPVRALEEYIRHRHMRERQVLEGLRERPARISDLVARIYAEVPSTQHPLAAQSLYAHLLKLRAEGRVVGDDRDGEWRLA